MFQIAAILVGVVFIQAVAGYLYVGKLKAENRAVTAQYENVMEKLDDVSEINKENIAAFNEYKADLDKQFEIITDVMEDSNKKEEEVTAFMGELTNVPISSTCADSEPIRRTLEFLRNRR